MTEPINLTQLREQYSDPGTQPGAIEDCRRILALIDIAEAAHAYARGELPFDSSLGEALARTTTGDQAVQGNP